MVVLRTRLIVAAVVLLVLDWQVCATYDATPILDWTCSPGPR